MRARHSVRWLSLGIALSLSGCFIERTGVTRGDTGGPMGDAAVDAGDGTPPDAARPDVGPASIAPGAPGAPTFSNFDPTSVRIAWTAPAMGPVASYTLERADEVAGAPGAFAFVASALVAPTFDDSGLAPSTAYWYRVRATNAIGDGPYSTASRIVTPLSPVVTRVQAIQVENNDPTATFATPPIAGNLLVAIGFHRLDDATPNIVGWDLQIDAFYATSGSDRRGLTVWTRVAGVAEPSTVQLDWSPTTFCHLLIQELAASSPVTWSFESTQAGDSGSSEVSELGVSTTPVSAGDTLVIAAFGARDDVSSDVMFAGMVSPITFRGSRSIASAFGQTAGGGTQMTTARWGSSRRASIGLVAFGLL